jgi:hypothetical protein
MPLAIPAAVLGNLKLSRMQEFGAHIVMAISTIEPLFGRVL